MRFEDHRKQLLGLTILASGFASLGYQIIWTKQLGAAIGLDAPAILAIATAIMGGFAIGAFLLNSRIKNTTTPFRTLGTLEFTIASWGLISIALAPSLPSMIQRLPSQDLLGNGLLFLFAIAAFLPSTVAMGATLPAMERSWSELAPDKSCLGFVYGLNTLGATFGVLIVAFLIIPAIGLQSSLILMCLVSGCIGGVLRYCFWDKEATETAERETDEASPREKLSIAPLFALGFLGMASQLLFIRILSQSLDNTVFTYASTLSIYLLGTAAGGFAFQRVQRESKALNRAIAWVVHGTSLVIILSLYIAPWIPQLKGPVLALVQELPLGIMFLELSLAALLLGLPTIGSGFLFSAFVDKMKQQTQSVGIPVGWNLLGATSAPLAASLLIPITGTRHLLMAIALGYLPLANRIAKGFNWSKLIGIAAICLFALLAPNSAAIMGLPSTDMSEHRITEGIAGTVSVVTDPDGHKRLTVNNHFMMGGTAATLSERRQAHLPLLLHPAPKNALFLGVGTGITIGAAKDHPKLKSEGIELIPEVLDQVGSFSEWNRLSEGEEKIELIRRDARRFIRGGSKRYDVIIGDVFHPARDGAGLLYTLEHFQGVRRRLNATGLFCQWLPLHQLDKIGFSSILKTFSNVFPHTSLWLLDTHINLPVVALIGSQNPLANWEERLENIDRNGTLFSQLKECRLHSSNRIASCLLYGIAQQAGGSIAIPLNTDDSAFLSHHAPYIRAHSRPYDLLASLLDQRGVSAITPPSLISPQWNTFLVARNHYLEGQIKEDKNELSEAVEDYLEGVRINPEFTLNYARVIRIASQFANTNPTVSVSLLEALMKIQPDEPLAKRLLERLKTQ